MTDKSLTTTHTAIMEQPGNAVLDVNVLQQSREILNLVSDIQIFNSDGKVNNLIDIGFPGGNRLPCYFFKINKLSYDEDYPHREALENVIMSLDNEAFNFVYLLEGTEEGVSLYLGVVKNHHPNQKDAQANDYGKLIEKVFEGNFNGSVLERLKNNTIRDVIIGGAKKFTEAQSEKGSLAITTARPLAHGKLNGRDITLVEYSIKTGRKHQIRAQSSLHGHSLAGDRSYGGKQCQELKREYYLHACSLTFPADNPLELPQIIKCPLPDDFIHLLECCEIKNPEL